MKRQLHRFFLGPATSFRNDSRAWLYAGFLLTVLLVLALAAARGRT